MNSEKFEAEYKELKDQAKKYYLDNVKEELEELEKVRIYYLFLVLVLFISMPFFVVVFVKAFIYVDDNIILNILYIIFTGIIILLYIIIPRTLNSLEYKKKLKRMCNLLLKPLDIEHIENNDAKNIQQCINKSNLFYKSNVIKTDDGFIGKYSGVDFEIEEISIEKHLDHLTDKKHSKGIIVADTSIFKGCAVSFASNKKIKILTHIKPKLYGLKLIGISLFEINVFIISILLFLSVVYSTIVAVIYKQYLALLNLIFLFIPIMIIYTVYQPILENKRKIKKQNQKLQKVELEDVVFSKDYDVYSYDQIESRYLITPAFIERFMFLQKVFKTKNICCAFVENQILLLISSKKNLFEIGNLFTSLKNPKYVENFYDEIIAILLLINHFKLNEHTGL